MFTSLCVSLEREPGSCLKDYYYFLTVPPWSLQPLPYLFSNYLNKFLGAQGSSWRVNEVHFLKARNGGHRKAFVPRSPTVLQEQAKLIYGDRNQNISASKSRMGDSRMVIQGHEKSFWGDRNIRCLVC